MGRVWDEDDADDAGYRLVYGQADPATDTQRHSLKYKAFGPGSGLISNGLVEDDAGGAGDRLVGQAAPAEDAHSHFALLLVQPGHYDWLRDKGSCLG